MSSSRNSSAPVEAARAATQRTEDAPSSPGAHGPGRRDGEDVDESAGEARVESSPTDDASRPRRDPTLEVVIWRDFHAVGMAHLRRQREETQRRLMERANAPPVETCAERVLVADSDDDSPSPPPQAEQEDVDQLIAETLDEGGAGGERRTRIPRNHRFREVADGRNTWLIREPRDTPTPRASPDAPGVITLAGENVCAPCRLANKVCRIEPSTGRSRCLQCQKDGRSGCKPKHPLMPANPRRRPAPEPTQKRGSSSKRRRVDTPVEDVDVDTELARETIQASINGLQQSINSLKREMRRLEKYMETL